MSLFGWYVFLIYFLKYDVINGLLYDFLKYVFVFVCLFVIDKFDFLLMVLKFLFCVKIDCLVFFLYLLCW